MNRVHRPVSPSWCSSCGEMLYEGCPETHEHWDCFSSPDTRQLWCGCYAHKECEKSGGGCLVHGGQDESMEHFEREPYSDGYADDCEFMMRWENARRNRESYQRVMGGLMRVGEARKILDAP